MDLPTALATLAALLALAALVAVLLQAGPLQRLRLLGEQALAGQRGESETLRLALAGTERGMGAAADRLRVELSAAAGELRASVDARLSDIQRSVTEQLHVAVERQMTASFARVADQFAALQKAMGEVQAVTADIGDLKRLFGNVKTRGGWGEAQVRAMLDDILPAGAYETNWKPRPGSDEMVEFAVTMPGRGDPATRLPVDSKFPVEDYERILAAAETGDAAAEAVARRALERRIRDEARKIAAKYICPPATVEFAVMYLPTDGLYVEVARMPGLIDELGRVHKVLVLGPTLFPALLRTIHLGHVTLSIERRAGEIGALLAATRAEMVKMDGVLDRLAKQAGGFANTIEDARKRTRVVGRRLRGLEPMEPAAAAALLGSEDEDEPLLPLLNDDPGDAR